MTGAFITIEGIDGCGKTTCAAAIERCLQERSIGYIRTREPGGTPMAEDIRRVVLAHREEKVAWISELLLMYAARAQHIENVIRPALEKGLWVISDRWTDSTFAYQCYARGEAEDLQNRLAQASMVDQLVVGSLVPDMTILLDVSVETGMARATARGGLDRFDAEKAFFHERTRAGFLSLAANSPDRMMVVDANRAESDVIGSVSEIVKTLIHRISRK